MPNEASKVCIFKKNTMKKLFAFQSFLLWAIALLLAQPSEINWEQTYGGSSDDEFHQIIEATNGYLIAIGETSSKTHGGKDGLLVISDFSTGQSMVEKRLGGNKDDILYDVVQSFDGGFFLVGSTKSKGKGKRDAWLVKVDDKGRMLWEQTFGSSGDDEFKQVTVLGDGTVVAVGTINDQKQEDIWIVGIKDKVIKWQNGLGRKKYQSVEGLTISRDGGLVLVGNTAQSSSRRKGDIWLVKTDIKGNLQWEKFFGERGWDEATSIITTADGGFAISGATGSVGAGDLDMWLIKTNSSGFQQWAQPFGGKDTDLAHSVTQTNDNGFLLTGATRSHRSGARQYKAFLVQVDGGGVRRWEYSLGGNKEDIGQSVIGLHDGSFIMAGHTESKGGGGKNAWLLRWNATDPLYGIRSGGIDPSSLEHSTPILATIDGQLKPQDQSYLSFNITNTSNADLPDVQVKVSKVSGTKGYQVWQNNFVGYLRKGENYNVKIPIKAGEALETGESQLGIALQSGNQTISNFKTTLRSKKPLAATVEIDNFQFEESRTSDDETLAVVVQNPGDFPATGVAVRFILPKGIKAKSPINQNLGTIKAHGSKRVNLTFHKAATFRDNRVAISCIVKFGKTEIRKTLERGSSRSNDVVLILSEPNESAVDIQNIISEKGVFDIKLGASATSPLKQQSFKLYKNSVAIDGSKMDEVDFSTRKKFNDRYNYNFFTKVHLDPGENRLEIGVQTPTGEYRTQTIVVYFEPRQPNLHILAIGPNHQDLKFTSQDANDFASAFENQGGKGKIYGRVFTRKLVQPEQTSANSIREAISDLVFQYQNPAATEKIKENDLLMVFVSSHGKNNNDGFKLLPSNYDARYERTRTIDFQRDVVKELEKINCKKIVFIDACHSGAADSKALSDVARAEALTQLAAMHPGMSTLTSCRANEMSYEDEKWGNGAFTEAILEAFNDIPVMDNNGAYKADTDNNSIITLAELYDFLKRRVPGMIRNQKPGAPTNQTPFMPENQLLKDKLPVFVVE